MLRVWETLTLNKNLLYSHSNDTNFFRLSLSLAFIHMLKRYERKKYRLIHAFTIGISVHRSIQWPMFLNLWIRIRLIHNVLARMGPIKQRAQPNLYWPSFTVDCRSVGQSVTIEYLSLICHFLTLSSCLSVLRR